MPQYNLLINGKSVPAESGSEKEIRNPANGEVLAKVASGGEHDVRLATESAATAFAGDWAKINSRQRGKLLFKLSQLIRDNQSELARLESQNVGKPIREANEEVELAADCFEYYAGTVNKFGGQTIPVSASGVNITLREPIGVCGLILPWNFPIAITSWKVAPALAMGNTVVIKPAEVTPLTALRLGELALEAGIPPGVVNVVTGKGSVVGEALVKNPLVRKISFTGSTEVGRSVMKLAADDIKRVTLELGGKSANLVFADADFDQAVQGAVGGVLGNAGQDCCARSRLLVQKEIYNDFIEAVAAAFNNIKMGDPMKPETEMGSLISDAQRSTVESYIESGQKEGAEMLCGGSRPEGGVFQNGAFLQPTLFANVTPEMQIMREEIFGPVLCATPFETEAEAVAIANNSTYGLSGSVWTRDIERALRVARAVQTGVISINTAHSVHLEAPFGGVKQSGLGQELGLAALEHYSQMKNIFIKVEN